MTPRIESPARVEPSPGAGPQAAEPGSVGVWGVGGYRPQLDGLRAVAVYLVVLFHAGSDRFVGGFVGVDVFFVLSGFLVTQLLLRDLVRLGSIRMGRFYARRFRRLLPAAFVALVVTAWVFTAVASPVEVAEALGGFRASFLYSANWYFIDQSADYFGADLSANPVLHFWSLAVEEQFYLLWPLLLGGLFVLARRFGVRQWQVLRLVVAVGAVASLLWAWSLRGSDPNRAYYGTDARAYQLMAGALVALTPGLVASLGRFARAARWVAAAGVVGLGLVASSWVDLDAIERGVVVTVITVALIVALETAGGGWVHGVLSAEPVVYLGKISYGTYLWHWPVILVIARSFELSVVTTIAMAALVATALASLSFQLMEHPIRVSTLLDLHRAPVIATGLALSVASALVLIPRVLERPTTGTPDATHLATTGFTPIPDNIDFAAVNDDVSISTNCYERPASDCTLVEGTGPHILVMGDSHAAMMIPTLLSIAGSEDLTLSASLQGGCPWQRDLLTTPHAVLGQALRPEECQRVKDDTYERVIPEIDPDIIIVMNLGYETPHQKIQYRGPDLAVLENGSHDYVAWLEETTVRSLAELGTGGRKIVVLEPIPRAEGELDPLSCLSEASVLEACRYLADPETTSLERIYRRLDRANDRVWSVDIDRLVCPYLPICDPIVDHQVVKLDKTHLSKPFARTLALPVSDYLESNGIIP